MARVQAAAYAFDPRAATITLVHAVPLDSLTSIRNLTNGEVLFLAEDYYSSPGSFRMIGNVLYLPQVSDRCLYTDRLEVLWETEGPIPSNPNAWTSYAPMFNPSFVGTVTMQKLRIADGKAREGYVLTADAAGNARWAYPSGALPLATETEPGAIQLTGDLGGTALHPVVVGKAPIDSPTFTGVASAPEMRVTGNLTASDLSLPMSGMGEGNVLTSDMFGNAKWATPRGESYRFDQSAPSSTWSVNHPLGREPNDVSVWVEGRRVFCDVDIPSTSLAVLTFGAPVAGYVTIT